MSLPSIARRHLLRAGAALLIMQTWALACPRCQAWGPFYRELKESMTQMETALAKADDGLVGDPDGDFMRLMIPHHQGAIDMAKAVLLHGKNPVARRLAQEIVVTQESEIAVMRRQLENRQTEARPPKNSETEPTTD